MKIGWFRSSLCAVSVLGFVGCGGSDGDNPPNPDTETTAITVGGSVVPKAGGEVEAYIFGQNQNGNAVTLGAANLSIQESSDGLTWSAVSFSAKDKQSAISVAMTMDYSGSMTDEAVNNVVQAVKAFIGLMRSGDAAELVKFSSDVEVVQPFTTDTGALTQAAEADWAGRGQMTALNDAIMQGISDTYARAMPWAVIALTDGNENQSTASQADVISSASGKGIPVFTVGFGNIDETYLQEIANGTGGFFYSAPDSTGVLEIYKKISGVLTSGSSYKWTSSLTGTVQVKITATYTSANGTYTSEKKFSYVR